jgi:hypothetical protein
VCVGSFKQYSDTTFEGGGGGSEGCKEETELMFELSVCGVGVLAREIFEEKEWEQDDGGDNDDEEEDGEEEDDDESVKRSEVKEIEHEDGS